MRDRRKPRECAGCKQITFTASNARLCTSCQKAEKRRLDTEREAQDISNWGFTLIEGPWYDQHNHRCYKLMTSCGHEWVLTFNNLRKQVHNAETKNLPQPCGVCGPIRRMQTALQGYVEVYGRDYDLDKFIDFSKKVRGLTERTYRKHKAIINPLDLPRGRAGTPGAYHVDHIFSIVNAFKTGWTPEQTADVSNLTMLTWEDNLTKGARLQETPP